MKKTMIMGFLLLGLFFTLTIQHEIPLSSLEMLYASDSIETIRKLEDTYPVSLREYDGRIGVFEVLTDDSSELINAGFVMQGQSQSVGSPWTKPVVNDPYYSQQYALTLTNTDEAWAITQGSAAITLAIIDTGIDTDHPEFENRLSSLSYNAATDQIGLEYVEDEHGHGTMVAGIIGANHNNSLGIAGVVNEATLLIIKANDVGEETFDDSDIIRAIYYAVDNGASVINLSLGSTYANPLTEEAVSYAYDHNVLVVAASGNDGNSDLMYPASFEQVLSVGSVEETGLIADYSNYNASVDLVAPGTDIASTSINNTYVSGSGTSFAAPYVAGIAGLYYSLCPDAEIAQVRNVILSTSTDQGTLGVDDYYGYGLINALAIVSVNHFAVTTIFPNELDSSITYVEEGGLWVPPVSPEIPYFDLEGWYLDSTYTIAFDINMPITADMTLYAHYVQVEADISFVIDGVYQSPVTYAIGEMPTLPDTFKEGYLFHGWYTDLTYETLVMVHEVTGHTTYYGYYELIIYQMVFMSYDALTPLETIPYSIVTPLTEMTGPAKPSSIAFSYVFSGWHYNSLFSDVIQYATPEYTRVFLTNSVGLNPGIDTIYQQDSYENPGAYTLSDEITLVASGMVDTTEIGEKILTYDVYEGDTFLYRFIRIVSVLPQPINNDITLKKGVSTLLQGSHYIESGATSELGDVEIIGTVDESIPGIYRIIYQVTMGDQIFQKSRYVVIIEHDVTQTVLIMPTSMRKDDDDEIKA